MRGVVCLAQQQKTLTLFGLADQTPHQPSALTLILNKVFSVLLTRVDDQASSTEVKLSLTDPSGQ